MFAQLSPPPSDDRGLFSVSTLALKGFSGHRIGKDTDGAPVLLLHVDRGDENNPPNILLENIAVMHDVPCAIWNEAQTTTSDRFTVIRCQAESPQLREYFLQVFEPVLNVVGSNPSQSLVSEVIDQLVEIFRAISAPSRGSVQGLWAELFMIARCADPVAAIESWHGGPGDVFDFSSTKWALEVKSSIGTQRKHEFSLEQLQGANLIVIASVLMQRAGGGASIQDLASRIRDRIAKHPRLLLRLDRLIWTTLGEEMTAALEQRFSEAFAVDTLKFFAADVVPKPIGIPKEVSGVRFTADLSSAQQVALQELVAHGPGIATLVNST